MAVGESLDGTLLILTPVSGERVTENAPLPQNYEPFFFGIENVPEKTPLTILTDSRDAVHQILQWQKGKATLPEWYNTKRNHPWTPNLIKLRDRVQMSGSLITVKWVKGHKGHPYNSAAHRLSQLGRRVLEGRLEPRQAKQEAEEFMQQAFTRINNSKKVTKQR